jgi:hypothetical protein
MHTRQTISIGNLKLDTSNYRIVKQDSQKEARDAIIAEQGRKLITLANDIVSNGLNPSDLPLVVDAGDGQQNFIVIEGNRRLTALQLLLTPDLADGTPIHAAFKKLNKAYSDAIPKVLECIILPSKKAGMVWINRKHASGLEGAGTEPWTSMSKARADVEQGIARPELDAVNFVMTQPKLDAKLRLFLEGSKFNITTLQRIIEAKDAQKEIGFCLQDGKLVSDQDKDRIASIFTEIVTTIARSEHANGEKFTEREVDTDEHRAVFLDKLLPKHPKRKKSDSAWTISAKPAKTIIKGKSAKTTKTTPTTEEQVNLIPKSFKLDQLPAGKVNDIFVELKELDVTKRRHAVSVLFRVFFELTLDAYIKRHNIQLPVDKNGHVKDSLPVRLDAVTKHAQASKLLSEKELKPIHVAISDKNSFLAPDTLNSYVHSAWMNPDPLRLKLSWLECQLFMERLWVSVNTAIFDKF